MKWNWGTKLFIATAAFMIMVIIFGIIMIRQSVDLVEKDYYPKGQVHQQIIDKRNNAHEFAHLINLSFEGGVAKINFPDIFRPQDMEGSVHFYHRVTDKRDRFAELEVDSNCTFSYPIGNMHGRYIVKIDWTHQGEGYYVEKSVIIP